jgi:hypothetical protein
MAVVQISRIQARRGLQQDLPALASAEFAWSVDTRKLYIGNGTLAEGAPTEGATEILTQYTDFAAVLKNYTFKGNAGGYTAQTTTSPLNPIVRTIQDKLDDIVSIKDFGAVGDGVADDTAAINRAIQQIYLTTRLTNYPQVRRTIFFPAGTYNVTGETILIPPYARLIGDGIESTIIKQTDGTQTSLFQFTDSMYQTGASLGQNSATLPGYITIENMTLATTSDRDVVAIDSAEHVTFFGVEFLGSLSSPTTAGSQAYAGVKINSFAATTKNINFWSCKFKNTRYAALSDDASSDVRMNGCLFVGLYKGLKLGQNSASVATTPSNYKILNSIFASVANNAIDCYANVTGVLSSGNHFLDVGNNFAGSGSPVASIISFVANGNTSANDMFDRPDADNVTVPRLSFNNAKNIAIQANVGLTVGTYTIGTSGYAVLADNTPAFTQSNINLVNGCTLTYSMTRGTGKRFGTLFFSNDGTTGANFIETATQTGSNIGVTISASNANVITYTTTSTGSPAIVKYNINYFS